MKKLLTLALLSSALYAEGFEQFLNRAVQTSPLLKASNLRVEQSTHKGKILTRYENPNLEVEASYFTPDTSNNAFGYRASYSQPVRLWGVGDAKNTLADANMALSKADYVQAKASFIYGLSLQYTDYALNDLLMVLAKEELTLASTIYSISKERYEAGTVSRGVMLQAQVDFKMTEARIQSLALRRQRSYYMLLKKSGISEQVIIDPDYTFSLETSSGTNPQLLQLENQLKSAQASAELNSNDVEWMAINAEYEKEPDQDIYRLGAIIPLAFFKTKEQEQQIAKLEATRSEMLRNNAQSKIIIELQRLDYEASALRNLQRIDEDVLDGEQELLGMYEDGYKIASINLLALQDAKARLIETKERLIRIKIELDRNAITQNYLQGTYND